ncbi:MAG: hypothetical protein ABIS35_07855 [Terracoccus sp.]
MTARPPHHLLRSFGRTALTAGTSALVSAGALGSAPRLPDGMRGPWARTNHAGDPVTLLEGPAWVAGAVAGALLSVWPATTSASLGSPVRSRSGRAAPVVVAIAAGALGALDDLGGDASSKGLRGHLGALSRGEVTTGSVKIVGLAASGVLGAALVDRPWAPGCDVAGRRRPPPFLSVLLGGAVIAGAANAVNLFDLRPGRALKVSAAVASVIVAAGPVGPAAPAALGASLGVLPADLAARAMLGDTGANAAGALLGAALVARLGPAGRAAALVALTALTLASERVSFTAVIARHPVLRRIDEWGRGTS